jgi:hypothetical protein
MAETKNVYIRGVFLRKIAYQAYVIRKVFGRFRRVLRDCCAYVA